MKKIIYLFGVSLLAGLAFVGGGNEAEKVSYNIDKEADNYSKDC